MPSICIPPWAGGNGSPARVRSPPATTRTAQAQDHLRPPSSRKSAMSVHWWNEGTGTPTNCSASCGSRGTTRCGTWCRMILGTSITCSTSGNELSRIFSTFTGCSTTSGTGTSSKGRTGALSAICSTVCRCTRSCGPDTAKSRSGREPPSSSTLPSSRS